MDLLMARWQANADQQWSAAENDAIASVTGPLSLFPRDQSDLLLSAEGVRLLEEEIARRQLEIDEPQQRPVYNTQQQQQQGFCRIPRVPDSQTALCPQQCDLIQNYEQSVDHRSDLCARNHRKQLDGGCGMNKSSNKKPGELPLDVSGKSRFTGEI